MDLFSITCTTCKSRLKVRDQAAIGQILACPKCGGMVMVKPPPAYSDGGKQQSDLPTATELTTPPTSRVDQTFDSSAFDVVDELLSDAPPKAKQPASFTPLPSSAPATPKPRFVGGPPRRQTPPAMPVGDLRNNTPKPADSPATAVVAPPAPPPPAESDKQATELAEAARASHGRYWLFMGGSIALGIMLAFGAVFLMLQLRPRATPQAADSPSRPAFESEQSATTNVPMSDVVPPSVAESSPSQAVTESLPPNTVTEPAQPAAVAESTPTGKDPIGILNSPTPEAPVSTAPLAKFDQLIGGADDSLLANTTPAPEPVIPAIPDTAPARPLAPRPPPREIDLSRRLADSLASLETTGTPLAEFVQLLSDLSTIPITLDLPLSPATTESAVVVSLKDTTVAGALKDALARLRLEYVVVGSHLLVRRQEPTPIAPIAHPVKDLTSGDAEQLNELAELLKAIVEPGAWEADGEETSLTADTAKSSLVIKHRRSVQYQVLIAIEKLRAARKPPLPHVLQLDKVDPLIFKPATRSSQAQATLAKSISLNYSQPTRLITILDRLAEAAGVRIVVDWIDVETAGWNPAGEAKLLVSKQPLAAALDALLDPLDLSWRIIDGRTIQVVTPARLASQGEFELYPLDDMLAAGEGEALAQRAKTALGDALFRENGGGAEIRFDAASRCLLAWLPQPKQRELEGLLDKWRTESKE